MTHTCLVDLVDDAGEVVLRRIDLNERVGRLMAAVPAVADGREDLQRHDGRLPAGEYSLYDLQALYSVLADATAVPSSYIRLAQRVEESSGEVFVMAALESLMQMAVDSPDSTQSYRVRVFYE